MNERIDKLAEQAGAKVHREQTRSGDWVDFSDYTGFDYQKFAKLIIQECADIAYKTAWGDLVHGYGQAVIPLHLHNTIKQNFGVDE